MEGHDVGDAMMVNKLAEMFEYRHSKLQSDLFDRLGIKGYTEVVVDEYWAEYLNGLDCTVIDRDDILEDFESIVNSSAQGRVCVYDKNYKDYILVPKELAMKALVLGGLPDSWFPEGSSTFCVMPKVSSRAVDPLRD